MRKEAKSDFEPDVFKLMNGAVHGKTMDNVAHHLDFELVSTSVPTSQIALNPSMLAGVELDSLDSSGCLFLRKSFTTG